MKIDSRYVFAEKLIQEAGVMLSNFSKKKILYFTKDNNPVDIVSEVDQQLNDFILNKINKNFPDDTIVSEESEKKDGSEYSWIIDPIDGTNAFVRGMKEYVIMLALCIDDIPMFSFIYAPDQNIFISSMKGKGTYLNNKIVRLKNKNILSDSHFAFDYGYTNRTSQLKQTVLKLSEHCKYGFTYASTGYSVMKILEGKIDFYVHSNISIWDYVAPSLMISEAGGTIYSSPSIIQTNSNKLRIIFSVPGLEKEVLSLLKFQQ